MKNTYDVREIEKIIRNMMIYHNTVNKGNIMSNTSYEILRNVVKKPGIRIVDIVNYLNVDKALVTRLIKKLIIDNYIYIINDTVDKRVKRIFPLDKAKELKHSEMDIESHFLNECMKVLTEEEKELYLKLTNKVYIESKRLRKNSFKDI